MLVISQIGGCYREDSMALGKYAVDKGVDAVGSIAPYDTPFADAGQLVDYLEPIAKAVAPLPFYYYHILAITHLEVSMVEFLKEAERRMPNLDGYDEMLLSGLAMGAQGGVGSTYNYCCPVYSKLMDAFEKGEIKAAQDAHYESVKMVEIIMPLGCGVRGGKAVMKLAGLDCGNCRGSLEPAFQRC